MGSKCSPEICDIRAFEVIMEILNTFDYKNKIIVFGRYRDDGLLTYSGTEEELTKLFRIANSHHNLLKFTYDISKTGTVFLDTVIFKGPRFQRSGILDIRSYTKPSNTYQYRHRMSYHNPAVSRVS